MEQKVSTTPKALQAVFGAMPRSRMALETGTHSPWVSRLLSGLEHEVIVAHARNVRLIGESRKKDDRMDARRLARIERDEAVEVGVFSLVDNTHPTTTEFFDDAVVRDSLVDHEWRRYSGCHVRDAEG